MLLVSTLPAMANPADGCQERQEGVHTSNSSHSTQSTQTQIVIKDVA
jgi:hypothetical protein